MELFETTQCYEYVNHDVTTNSGRNNTAQLGAGATHREENCGEKAAGQEQCEDGLVSVFLEGGSLTMFALDEALETVSSKARSLLLKQCSSAFFEVPLKVNRYDAL